MKRKSTNIPMNTARCSLFSRSYKMKNPESFTNENVKNVDPSNLPPCEAELRQHNETNLNPENYDWIDQNNQFKIKGCKSHYCHQTSRKFNEMTKILKVTY